MNVTTHASLQSEIARQQARLAFTVDPTHARILQASIADLLDALGAYPAGLLWCADQRPKFGPPEPSAG